MTTAEAVGHIRSWIDQPPVQVLISDWEQMNHAFGLLESLGAAANLVTDAQIAAAAMEHRAVLHTADSDFAKFPGLSWFNPLTGARGN